MSDRKYNEEKYNNLKVEGDNIKNAIICDQIADDSLMWDPSEAIYWRKKAIEKIENHYGKHSMENTVYYDKIVNDLLEKGSYQQAVKWNKKSLKIKIKEKGEFAFEVLINDLYGIELNVFLKKYDEVASDMKRVRNFLQQKSYDSVCMSHQNMEKLYNIYLKLIFIEITYKINTKEELGDIINYANNAINIAELIYGKDSMEIAEAYRVKAIGLRHEAVGRNNIGKQLELLNKALVIAIKKEGNRGKKVQKIFYDIRQCWDEEVRWSESIKWVCANVSKEFVLDIMGVFPIFIQQEINDILNSLP